MIDRRSKVTVPSRSAMERMDGRQKRLSFDGYSQHLSPGSMSLNKLGYDDEVGGSTIYYAKITGTTTTWVYTATIYTTLDDTGAPYGTGTASQTIKVPTGYLASGEVIPNDTILECRRVSWKASTTLATTITFYTVCQHVGLI